MEVMLFNMVTMMVVRRDDDDSKLLFCRMDKDTPSEKMRFVSDRRPRDLPAHYCVHRKIGTPSKEGRRLLCWLLLGYIASATVVFIDTKTTTKDAGEKGTDRSGRPPNDLRMRVSFKCNLLLLSLSVCATTSGAFLPTIANRRIPSQTSLRWPRSSCTTVYFSSQNAPATEKAKDDAPPPRRNPVPIVESNNFWEGIALNFVNLEQDPSQIKDFVQYVSLLRVGLPAFLLAASANLSYPVVAMTLARLIDDSGVFAVVAQDASQFIQNILTTSGLVFSLIVGQTYYFMVRCAVFSWGSLSDHVTANRSAAVAISHPFAFQCCRVVPTTRSHLPSSI